MKQRASACICIIIKPDNYARQCQCGIFAISLKQYLRTDSRLPGEFMYVTTFVLNVSYN